MPKSINKSKNIMRHLVEISNYKIELLTLKSGKMKTLNYFFVAICAVILLSSCGKDSDVVNVTPYKTEISGDLVDYLQIVDAEYELVDDWGAKLSIKVRAIKKMEADLDNAVVSLKLSLLKENGMPVSGTGELSENSSSDTKLRSLLATGKGEDIISFSSLSSGYREEEHGDKVKKFSVFSEIEFKEKTRNLNTTQKNKNKTASVSNSVSSKPDEKASAKPNTNWNKVLKKYEKFSNDYIRHVKKITALQKKGNNASTIEITNLMPKAIELNQEASELGEQLQNASGDLTAAQMAKFTKIQAKFTKAALELSAQQI